MPPLNEIISQFTPGASGVWVLVMLVSVYMLREWRETRKMSADDRMARREGYARQVQELLTENRQLRNEMMSMNQRHEDYRRLCHQETDQLRTQIANLQNQMAGILRKASDVVNRAARGELNEALASSVLQIATEAAEATNIATADDISKSTRKP